jgi:hypothetical protein
VQGTVSDKVTAGVKRAFSARDIAAKDLAGWDLTEAGIPAAATDLLLGGEIKTFWIDTISSAANTRVTTKIEMRVVVADPKQRKIVRVLNVNSSLERGSVAFSTRLVEETISEALTAAVNQIFSDQELMSRFR